MAGEKTDMAVMMSVISAGNSVLCTATTYLEQALTLSPDHKQGKITDILTQSESVKLNKCWKQACITDICTSLLVYDLLTFIHKERGITLLKQSDLLYTLTI
jgi:hypothetical protein